MSAVQKTLIDTLFVEAKLQEIMAQRCHLQSVVSRNIHGKRIGSEKCNMKAAQAREMIAVLKGWQAK